MADRECPTAPPRRSKRSPQDLEFNAEKAIIEATFLKKMADMDSSLSVANMKVQVKIKSIEKVTPKAEVGQAFAKIKEDFLAGSSVNTTEVLVFKGCGEKEAVEISAHNIDEEFCGDYFWNYLTAHPGLAFEEGLTLVAFKSIPEKFANTEDYLLFKTNRQLLPYGIIHLDLQIVETQLSTPYPNAKLNWKLGFDPISDVSHETLIDVSILDRDTLKGILKSSGSFKLVFQMNFMKATTKLRELIENEDYVALRDAELNLGTGPLTFSSTYKGSKAHEFLDIVGVEPKMSKPFKKKGNLVHVIWSVNHQEKDLPLASLKMHLTCAINCKMTHQRFPLDLSMPVLPPFLTNCEICDKIGYGAWVQFAQCTCLVHLECFKKSGSSPECPLCERKATIRVKEASHSFDDQIKLLMESMTFPKTLNLL